uniref:Uncharacterized protein n=1 Tax=Anguilla anguilla TaxID=7936 RepID=A0A0E9RWD3_ANGAN
MHFYKPLLNILFYFLICIIKKKYCKRLTVFPPHKTNPSVTTNCTF